LGRRDEAKAAYLKAHELDAQDAKTTLALGTVYGETGEFERSVEILNSIPAEVRPSSALPVLASDYFALHQPDKVAALAHWSSEAHHRIHLWLLDLRALLLDNGFVDDAGELLKSAPENQKLLLIICCTRTYPGTPRRPCPGGTHIEPCSETKSQII